MTIHVSSSAQIFSPRLTIPTHLGASLFSVFTENLTENNFHWPADSIKKFKVWWKSYLKKSDPSNVCSYTMLLIAIFTGNFHVCI